MPDSDKRTDRDDAEEKTLGSFSFNDVSNIAREDGKKHAVLYPYVVFSYKEVERFANSLNPDKYLIEETANVSDETRKTVKSLYSLGYLSGYINEIARLNEEAEKAGKKPVPIPLEDPYSTSESTDRRRIIDRGISEGKKEAKTLYPHVTRSREEVEDYAHRKIKKDMASKGDAFSDDNEEYERQYVTGYVAGYLEEVVELDKKVAIPPPSPTGARATVVRVERDDDEYRYYIELTDPGYIDGVLELDEPLYYPVGEGKPAQASSGYGYAIAGSDVYPVSHSPQQAASSSLKGGRRLHLKKR